jgi:hypothetical protein
VRWIRLSVVVTAIVLGVQARSEPPGADTIAVVVGRDSFIAEIDRDVLRELYMRRQRLWANGTAAMPVNLPADHALRERFSRLVLGRAVRDLVAYWNARYFEGIRPPIVLPSGSAVCAYVRVEPGAIGYVPVTDVDDGCRVLLRLQQ